MISDNQSICPKCGGQLKYYDHVQRLVRTKFGNKKWVAIRRLRCCKCHAVHRELPDFIFPYNRIALDVAALNVQHVRLDENGRFLSVIDDGLNNCLTLEANVDQTARSFIQDVVISMFDEGSVAIVPVDTTTDPNVSGSYDIQSLRVGQILDWYPQYIRTRVYNEQTGRKEDIVVPKSAVAIIENPLYAVINEPNSTMQRLIRKLNLLDVIDEQSGSGKLDLIIQLPYVIKTEARRQQAENRRKDIENQLSGSKYGIAYTDGTEHITQLNRSVNNNLMSQIEYLTSISRIRTRQADLRNIEALRAKGYKKGTQKGYVGNIQLLHRTTDPQTVYVKSKLDRDDIIDIQDFDVVQYLYGIDRMNLNEELATAIMTGDGREVGADGKIAEDKIRPIWLDDELYTIHADVDIAGMKSTLQGTNTSANFGENYIYAEAVIQSLLYAREKYKGSGTPDFYCTPHLVNVMLLARDLNGRRIYDKVSDLAAALNVGQIITAEQFEGKTRTTTDSKTKKLLGLMVNLADYSLGATKGGEITHFTDFDIDFNQEKSLLETRCSGANTRVMSAIALEEDVTANIGG